VGCETAEFLVAGGGDIATVTVLEMLDRLAPTISPTYRPFFLARLKKMGVLTEMQTTVEAITDRGVMVNRKGVSDIISADSVILAVGLKSDHALVDKFRGTALEVFSIGDCVKPRMIREAIEEGFSLGTKI
jgi:pyruvate/2-oxoglutarate dehydrogenase complex dihydrolipoamide dehydrogenase (E3) component